MTLEIIKYLENWLMKQTSSLTICIPGFNDSETTSTILTSAEDHQGLNYHFTAQAMRDGNVEEFIEGRARLAGENAAGTVVYTTPELEFVPPEATLTPLESMRVNLPAGTLFPIKHLRRLLEEAQHLTQKSVKVIKCIVFDGSSDVRDAVRIDAVLAQVDPQTKSVEMSDKSILKPNKLWRSEMAVYTLSNSSNEPDYKVNQIFSDQGIIFEMIVDYGEYKMVSKLTDLRIFTTEDSAQKALRMVDAAPAQVP